MTMLKVYVCEDSVEQREKIERYISNYLMIEKLDAKLAFSCANPNELIGYITENRGRGLYFLDVDLQHEMSGIELATEIRKIDPRGIIVFITSHSELMYLTFVYKVEAMDYILKDKITDIQMRVIDCISMALERINAAQNETREKFQKTVDGKLISVFLDDIMFFVSSHKKHKVVMHLDNRQVEFYGSLKELACESDHFCRCHQSYLVNKMNIVGIDRKGKEIEMRNGEKCFASSRMLKHLEP